MKRYHRRLMLILALLFMVSQPVSDVEALNYDSPWKPFIVAAWGASTAKEYQHADALFDKILKTGSRLPHEELKFIWGLNRLASFHHNNGDLKREEFFRVRAFRLQEKELGAKNPLLAEPLKRLSHIWESRKENTRAKQALERALKLIEDSYGTDHLLTIDILEKLEHIYRIIGKPKVALALQRRIAKQLLQALPASSPTHAVLQATNAKLLELEGENAKAVEMQQSALNLYMKKSGPFHLARIKLLLSLADSKTAEKKYEDSVEHLKSALAISENMKGVDHHDLFHILIKIAKNHQMAGKPLQASPFLQRSLALAEKKHGVDHPDIAFVNFSLAENFRLDNQLDQAIPLYSRSVAILQGDDTLQPHHHSLLAKALNGLAKVYQTKGKIVSAESNNRQAVEQLVKVEIPGSPAIVEALNFHRQLVTEMTEKREPGFVFPKKKRAIIKLLQQRLSNLGIDPGPIDGYSGPKTRKAIAIYNTRMGLLANKRGRQIPMEDTIAHIPPVLPLNLEVNK